ncbi:PE-PPE domain-containing protein [Mycobacterium sp.]|uniref:PE-PPE domain-containing protein n=1 Tax=Mycobacterium sp. TaxID=1785 RepID=UPI0031D27F09
MTHRNHRRLGVALLATAGAAFLAATSATTAALAHGDDGGLAFIMGGTLNPQPDPSYVTAINDAYIQPNPAFTGYTPFGLYTPEGVNIPGINGLTLSESVTQGEIILNNAILGRPAGADTLAFGYSQSAAIVTLEMNALDALPADERPSPSDLSFMMIGDLDNPDGGLFERFALNIPIVGIPFYGPTPPDTPYPTDIYSGQYDGVADFPQYPANLLADLNAVLGADYVHTSYPKLTAAEVKDAVPLATSPGYYEDGGVTHYFMIPTQNLPLLEPLRAIPLVGNPLAALLQPDLTVLVNLGYNPNGYANVPTPAQLLPGFAPFQDLLKLAQPLLNGLGVYLPQYPSVPGPDFNLLVILAQLATGAVQGVQDFLVQIGLLPSTDLATTYPAVNSVAEVAAVADVAGAASPAAASELVDPSWLTSLADVVGSAF